MFNGANSFNETISYDASNNYWITSKVTNMFNMFVQAYVFNQNIGAWDVSKITDAYFMLGMFFKAFGFNNGQAPNNNTQPMNWTISFIGTPTNFSAQSPLALEVSNKPTFRSS